eukprot:6305927-Amphidinium_carterae.2
MIQKDIVLGADTGAKEAGDKAGTPTPQAESSSEPGTAASASMSAHPPDHCDGIARAVQEARSSSCPEVENEEAMLKAILLEGETASMPVRDTRLLITVNSMTMNLKGIASLASADEVATKNAQIKKWCETMTQLTTSITKAKDDLKRHLAQCERAKKTQEKKQKEAIEKKAVDEANRQAKEAAEKLLEEKSKRGESKPCVFSLARALTGGPTVHWQAASCHDSLETFTQASSKSLKILKHESVKALTANAIIQKQLTTFSSTHKKHKDFQRAQFLCTLPKQGVLVKFGSQNASV